jgi:hypothetical protein
MAPAIVVVIPGAGAATGPRRLPAAAAVIIVAHETASLVPLALVALIPCHTVLLEAVRMGPFFR